MPALVVPEIQNRRWSGQTLRVVDVAREYGFTDVDGKVLSPFWENVLARTETPPG